MKFQIIQDDALNPSLLSQNYVDLIVTSPPYNIGKKYDGNPLNDSLRYSDYLEFTAIWLKNAYLWSRKSGRICINVSLDTNKNGKYPLSADITTLAIKIGWKYHTTIIWNEGNISRRTAWGSWKSASAPHLIAPVETIIVLYKNEWKKKTKGQNDITADEFKDWVLAFWKFNGENGKKIGHEAPFPRELPKRCIKLFSYIGDIVLDPFLGSGTTMIEAIQNRRKAIGIEKEEKYCQLSRERIKKECNPQFVKSSQNRRKAIGIEKEEKYCQLSHERIKKECNPQFVKSSQIKQGEFMF